MFGDKCHRLPKRVIPLRGNGCRRIPHDQRPHTFEILLSPRKSFQFAAADEYEVSDWLQAFVQAASGVSMLYTSSQNQLLYFIYDKVYTSYAFQYKAVMLFPLSLLWRN